MRRRLADRLITIELTSGARALIARQGYDPVYGARPLRRYIQREVETRIARALISGEVIDGAMIAIDADGELLILRWNEATPEESAPAVAEAAA